MTLLKMFDLVSNHTPDEFVAPIPSSDSVSLRIKQNNIVYVFNVIPNGQFGWKKCKPIDKRKAVIVGDADVWDVEEFLQVMPTYHLIVTHPVDANTWMAFPFNYSDAEQRGWDGNPFYVQLVDYTEPFNVIVARRMGDLFIFERNVIVDSDIILRLRQDVGNPIDYRVPKNYAIPVQVVAQRIEAERIEQARIEKEIRDRAAQQEMQSKFASMTRSETPLEDRIRAQLGFMGAKLIDWQKVNRRDSTIAVTFEHNGATWTFPQVDPQTLHVNVIGFCVSGTDRNHSLASAVEVFDTARKLHRHDIPSEMHLDGSPYNKYYEGDHDHDYDYLDDDE